jgi:sugar lactone lactonase YvrE
MDITRVGDFKLGWGESLVWDDRRRRLYFADCAAQTLHWLDDGDDQLQTLKLPSMLAGIVPTQDDRLVGVLDDGLHVIDPDTGDTQLLAGYPDGLGGGRCNDACADLSGNLVTGKLNIGPAEGSAWWYSASAGWRLVDPDIANTNGPQAVDIDGKMTLIVGDSSADYFAYDYEPSTGAVGLRRVFGALSTLDGVADGTTLDVDDGLWCALCGGSQLVRFTSAGLDRTIPLPIENPTDVTFGGPDLDRLYVVSIGLGTPDDATGVVDGALLVIDGLGTQGRPEPGFTLPAGLR